MKYAVEIKETLSRLVDIEAPDSITAKRLVEAQYSNSEIILSADDFVCTDIRVTDSHIINTP
jgi:hypothetical protein